MSFFSFPLCFQCENEIIKYAFSFFTLSCWTGNPEQAISSYLYSFLPLEGKALAIFHYSAKQEVCLMSTASNGQVNVTSRVIKALMHISLREDQPLALTPNIISAECSYWLEIGWHKNSKHIHSHNHTNNLNQVVFSIPLLATGTYLPTPIPSPPPDKFKRDVVIMSNKEQCRGKCWFKITAMSGREKEWERERMPRTLSEEESEHKSILPANVYIQCQSFWSNVMLSLPNDWVNMLVMFQQNQLVSPQITTPIVYWALQLTKHNYHFVN